MSFDIRTLLVAVTLATAFCAGARLLLWRMHLTIPGLGHWALAGGSAIIAFIWILYYGIFHWQPALLLAQLFVVISLMLSWDGFRRFLGKPLTLSTLAWATTLTLIWALITYSHFSVAITAIGNSVLMAALSLLIARDLLLSPQQHTPALRITGSIYAINGAVFLTRAMIAQESPTMVDPLNPNGVAAFMLLWLLCSVIAITLGMILMTAERLQADLIIQANHDPLTGALNRRSSNVLYKKAIAHSRRHAQPLSLLMMDLDEFKKVNDQLGHALGDKILCRFVSVTQKTLRTEDIFCRFGGEEFVALLPNTSMQAALSVANRLRCAFEIDSSLMETNKSHPSFSITVSVGIAELQPDENFENLLRRADNALYLAKNNGRNRCELAP
ncbi:diguanylate cyclase [Oceanisphaera sp. W20_SRM_FM3]|uniref:GGDEF domain-containing protein n=1 Tax=Oceanisphaera sp. W20_SRM_FM3 TaxID=3240267 RepID=UPI003F99EE2A